MYKLAFSSNKIRENVTQSMIRAKLNEHCQSIRKSVYVLKTSGDENVDMVSIIFLLKRRIKKKIINKYIMCI